MKKFLFLYLFSILITTGIHAQKMTEVKPQALPKKITEYISRNIPGGKVSHAVKVEEKGNSTYNVAIDVDGKKQILLFDLQGKFLRKGDNILDRKSSSRVQSAPNH